MGPISPSCHPWTARLTITIGKGSIQAVVDHEYRFWNINVGWPGKVHNARVFTNSELFEKVQAGTLLPSSSRLIHGVNVPLLIVADHAYPLLPWLMKPCVEHGNVSAAAKNFNYRLSRARMVVENAFGRLKGRWRCLLKRNDAATEDIPSQPLSRHAVYFTTFVKYTRSNLMTRGWKSLHQG